VINLLSTWLKVDNSQEINISKFSINLLKESCNINDDIKNHVKKLIRYSVVDEELFEIVKNMAGWQGAVETLVDPSLPENPKFKRGFFGEVVTSNTLIEIFDYIIPIQKLEYAMNKQSLPGTDVIALKVENNEITEICYLESKLRTSESGINTLVTTAYEQLNKDLSLKIPSMSTFLLKRLHKEKHHLFSNFFQYLINRTSSFEKEIFRIGIVCDINIWNVIALQKLNEYLEDSLTQRIVVDVILVKNLATLIDELFQSCNMEIINEDE
jgi:predicted restriction endonuclease